MRDRQNEKQMGRKPASELREQSERALKTFKIKMNKKQAKV